MFNWLEGGETPPIPLERLRELGFRLIIVLLSIVLAATHAVQDMIGRVKRDGSPISVMGDGLVPFDQFTDFIGMPEIRVP